MSFFFYTYPDPHKLYTQPPGCNFHTNIFVFWCPKQKLIKVKKKLIADICGKRGYCHIHAMS